MHLPFSDTQEPICFLCWGVVKHSFIYSFTYVHHKTEKQNLDVSFENVEVYKRPFSMDEFQDALHRAHETFTEILF